MKASSGLLTENGRTGGVSSIFPLPGGKQASGDLVILYRPNFVLGLRAQEVGGFG